MENKKEIIRPCSLDMEGLEIEKEKSDIISLASSSSKNIEEIECKSNRKEIVSTFSDSTSYTDNLSFSSESSFPYYYSNGTQSINYNKPNENNGPINYYEGVENYFKVIMPEKFNEYKKTKNYLPKNLIKEKSRNFVPKEEEIFKTPNKNKEKNKFDNTLISFQNNMYNPLIGNLYFYPSNNFFFNYPFININNNETKKNEESKNEKESQIKNEVNNTKNEDSKEKKDLNIIKKKEKYQKYNRNSNDEKNQKAYFNNSNKEQIFVKNKINYNNHNNNFYYKNNNINISSCDNYYKLNDNKHWKSKNIRNLNKYNKFNKFNNYDNRRNQYSFIYY